MNKTLFWFREDLRLTDNIGLYHASQREHDGLIALYIFSEQDIERHDTSPARTDLICRQLEVLSAALAEKEIPLLVEVVHKTAEIPGLLAKLCEQHDIGTLIFNQQYEVNEMQRDVAVAKHLEAHNIMIEHYHDQTIIPPGEVLKKDGEFYTVFTPFKKQWFVVNDSRGFPGTLPKPRKQKPLKTIKPTDLSCLVDKFARNDLSDYWPADEAHALKKLKQYSNERIQDYQTQRDFPALNATSQISPYLACGMLSPRQCLEAALEANDGHYQSGNKGVVTWISEVIWREFYKHILFGFPHVCKHQAFKQELTDFPWNNNEDDFNAWCEGRTGYPLVDAAMRQLRKTGWMHNRLRMVVAMFLTKDLIIDWRWGEKFFMQHLIDGDLAANNGGWQWSAGTGVDAAPYFRIFNPITQSEKFDPDGEFIRIYCPELASLDASSIHFPNPMEREACHYPDAIVDHKSQREAFMTLYKAFTGK